MHFLIYRVTSPMLKSFVLSDQQSETKRCMYCYHTIYDHKKQQILTFKNCKLETIWLIRLKSDKND